MQNLCIGFKKNTKFHISKQKGRIWKITISCPASLFAYPIRPAPCNKQQSVDSFQIQKNIINKKGAPEDAPL